MCKDVCLDMIISLIKGHKQGHNSVLSGSSRIRGAHYLLGQVVRQYGIPDNNHYISKEAKLLWNKLSDDNIWNYTYTNPVVLKDDITLPKYVGAEKKPRENRAYRKGDRLEFNSVFHDEHIISIKEIIRQLDSIPDEALDYDHVKRVLDSIVICRILKEEDKKLQRRRFATFEDNYNRIYVQKNVILENDAEEYVKRSRIDL